jgi:2-C-methyl-D-erythritol 4-phosphate cytidylyltransferase
MIFKTLLVTSQDKFTDEATVVEAFGLKINLIEGEEGNIKITNIIDLAIADNLLKNSTAIS